MKRCKHTQTLTKKVETHTNINQKDEKKIIIQKLRKKHKH